VAEEDHIVSISENMMGEFLDAEVINKAKNCSPLEQYHEALNNDIK
jgi:hypothetical protein